MPNYEFSYLSAVIVGLIFAVILEVSIILKEK